MLKRLRLLHCVALATALVCGGLAANQVPAADQNAPDSDAEVSTVRLWPDAAPGAEGDDAGDVPRMTIYSLSKGEPTAAVVVLPGGGYANLMTSYEGHDVAQWLNSIGIAAGVCEYRTRGRGADGKGYGYPYPLQDAQRAIRYLRAEAEKLNIDPSRVGVLGFSAGGHLASVVATHYDSGLAEAPDPVRRQSSRPDFAILCYPVISLNRDYAHRGSARNLLGPNPDPIMLESLSTDTQVTEDTPPTFLWHTAEDRVVPAENSVQFFLALTRKSVPAELHVFEAGRHGLGLAADTAGAAAWPDLCRQWLVNRGILKQPANE